MWPLLEPLLPRVSKPARYIGGEDGMQTPSHGPGIVSWLLTYPDTYEVGLPNQGLQILYEIINERPDSAAERAYAPWVDLEALMRAEGLPLFSLDTHRPAPLFDVVAFNLSAELTYTNVLNCIDLAGVPVRGAERRNGDPLIAVGGHCTYNPEPLADFVDFVVLGDGEEVVGEITDVLHQWKVSGRRAGRHGVLRELASVRGVYVPSLYDAVYDAGRFVGLEPRHSGVPPVVEKRTVSDLADWPYPKRQLVPLTEVVHDRLNVEVFRGCTRGCRFCQAGMITRPVRERPASQVRSMVREGLRRTGYDEVALTSLSTADFSGIEKVVADTVSGSGCDRVSVALPSLRVDAFTVGIAAQIQRARRTGLTFAPEAGSWRMRRVINKLITEEDLYGAVESAYSQGWNRMKLYFLVGLPTETDEDTLGISDLARNCVSLGRTHRRSPSVTVSVGGFVPKPFTPFQWFGQNTVDELRRKIGLLRKDLRGAKGVQLKWHDPAATVAEGLASRGDRRLGPVIEHVWRSGGTFQEWSEHFDVGKWLDAMAACGLDPDYYVYRHRTLDEVLPWDHLSAGLHKDFLWQDWRDALDEVGLEDCRWTPCYDCGACTGYGIEHIVASAVPARGGKPGHRNGPLVQRTGAGAALRAPPGRRGGTLVSEGPAVVARVRVRFAKHGKVRFTSHRDVARIWERAGVPVAYSEGFTPRPKIAFGLALSTGYCSDAEYLDVDLDPARAAQMDDTELTGVLTAALPAGLTTLAVARLPGGGPSLQHAVTSCTWRIDAAGADAASVSRSAGKVLACRELLVERERKGRAVIEDIRPAVLAVDVEGNNKDGVRLIADLGTQPRAVRPAELLASLDPQLSPLRVCRLHQWIATDSGERREPLAVADMSVAQAGAVS